MKAMTVTVLDLHSYNPVTQREKQNKISKGCGRRKSKSAERMLAKTRIKKVI
jgi:hypothetical protein